MRTIPSVGLWETSYIPLGASCRRLADGGEIPYLAATDLSHSSAALALFAHLLACLAKLSLALPTGGLHVTAHTIRH